MSPVIVIGAGLNGLVTAVSLARAGRKVLVLEQRAVAGGQAAPARFHDGTSYDPLHAGGQLRPDIVRKLGLSPFGLPVVSPAPLVSLLPGGRQLRLTADASPETLASIAAFSKRDAEAWPGFVAFMKETAEFLDAAWRTPMPRLPRPPLREGLPLAVLALKLRRLGARDMFRVIRAIPMPVRELAEEWFEAPELQAAICAVAIHGSTLGPMSAGTGLTLIHNWLNRGGPGQPVVPGGVGALVQSLTAALQAAGGELRLSTNVEAVLVDCLRARGVRIEGGEVIPASVIVSAADPRKTLLGLVGAPELPPEFVWQVQSIRMRGSVAKMHLRTGVDHGLPQGTCIVAPSVAWLERAFDASKCGQVSTRPYLEITHGPGVVSLHFQFAPHALRGMDWEAARPELERVAVDTVTEFAPGLRTAIREVRSLTPEDIAQTYALSEGDLNHGQLQLDQTFFMRPVPGWPGHRTPVDGLWLCGGGTHGGGGVSGAAGRNAARAILKALRR